MAAGPISEWLNFFVTSFTRISPLLFAIFGLPSSVDSPLRYSTHRTNTQTKSFTITRIRFKAKVLVFYIIDIIETGVPWPLPLSGRVKMSNFKRSNGLFIIDFLSGEGESTRELRALENIF